MTGDPINCIIKFGGSAITVKDQLESVNPDGLKSACELIAACYEKNLRVIIVHGAGSFGHHQAKEYQVKSGYSHLTEKSSIDKVKHGFCVTRQSVLRLSSMIVDALLPYKVPAVAVSPCGIWRTSSGRVVKSDTEPILDLVNAGFIPILHGDCCLDDVTGCTILSGDTIIQEICQHLQVENVLFLTDVDAIYDRPPNVPGAARIPQITLDTAVNIVTAQGEHDVTGGIQLKLTTARSIVEKSKGRTCVLICRVGSIVAQTACLHGIQDKYEEGTVISASGNEQAQS